MKVENQKSNLEYPVPLEPVSKNIAWTESSISKEQQKSLLGYESTTIWFTGLSGAGKSTLAFELEQRLLTKGLKSVVLDGDNVRHGLNRDLGFSARDRMENIRRVAEVCKLFNDSDIIAISSFITPYAATREMARSILGTNQFLEIYLSTELAVCERRDPKGLYRKARTGLISGFTGIDDPYEPPTDPTLKLDTAILTVDECLSRLLGLISSKLSKQGGI